jgi:D-sedoheptulose 7-phosphate isomerase
MNGPKEYINQLQETLDLIDLDRIHAVIGILETARHENKQIFIMGNGGSASTASHFVCDLAKNTRQPGMPLFRVIGLADNMAILSAYANDEGYDSVFASQLANLVQPNDVVIAISTSGNSENVINAIRLAKQAGALTIGMTGFDGGVLGQITDVDLHVPSSLIEHVEDTHLILEHLICKALRDGELPTLIPELKPQRPAEVERESSPVEKSEYGIHEGSLSIEGQTFMGYLDRISEELSQSKEIPNLIHRTLELALSCVGATSGTIMALNEAGDIIQASLAYRGEVRFQDPGQLAAIVTEGLAGWVMRNRQAALVKSTRDDPRWLRRAWEEGEDGSRSAISVPLTVGADIVGILTLVHAKEREFITADLALLMAISVVVSLNWPEGMGFRRGPSEGQFATPHQRRRGGRS